MCVCPRLISFLSIAQRHIGDIFQFSLVLYPWIFFFFTFLFDKILKISQHKIIQGRDNPEIQADNRHTNSVGGIFISEI